jgi:hypothetical protein
MECPTDCAGGTDGGAPAAAARVWGRVFWGISDRFLTTLAPTDFAFMGISWEISTIYGYKSYMQQIKHLIDRIKDLEPIISDRKVGSPASIVLDR